MIDTVRLASSARGRTFNLYVCGVTPYDASHVGHAATFLTYDILVRALKRHGAAVRMIRNVTDLDEPIGPKVHELGVDYMELTRSETAQFRADLASLNCIPPDEEPLVSDHVALIEEFVAELEAKGLTYAVDNTIYFDSSQDASFGSLSGFSQDAMIDLARQRGGSPDDPQKRNPLDWILWRPSGGPEPEVPSRFGAGMPGWHIGCSALIRAYFDGPVDLHGGGADLVFPHHECEAAQMRFVPGLAPVERWHHCEFVLYDNQKMSKSLGNVVFVRDLLRRWDPMVVRLAVLQNYRYSAGMSWVDDDLRFAEHTLQRWRLAEERGGTVGDPGVRARFLRAIDTDLDTPTAVREVSMFVDAFLSGDAGTAAASRSGASVRDLVGELGVIL